MTGSKKDLHLMLGAVLGVGGNGMSIFFLIMYNFPISLPSYLRSAKFSKNSRPITGIIK